MCHGVMGASTTYVQSVDAGLSLATLGGLLL